MPLLTINLDNPIIRNVKTQPRKSQFIEQIHRMSERGLELTVILYYQWAIARTCIGPGAQYSRKHAVQYEDACGTQWTELQSYQPMHYAILDSTAPGCTVHLSCPPGARLPCLLSSKLGGPCIAWGISWRVAQATVSLGNSFQNLASKNKVCFWVLKGVKTLPPDLSTLLCSAREGNGGLRITFPNCSQEWCDDEGHRALTGRGDPSFESGEKTGILWELKHFPLKINFWCRQYI